MLRFILLLSLCLLTFRTPSVFAELKIIASIKPLQLLTQSIMQDTGEPLLLIDGGVSPHSYRLTPSDAMLLEQSDLIIWVGPAMESKLARPLNTLTDRKRLLNLSEQKEIRELPARSGGVWAEADKHDHEHHSRYMDPHIWLDPNNAIEIAKLICLRLQEIDTKNAQRYASNTERLIADIANLDKTLSQKMQDVKQVPYLVFHDAFQYFEHRYSLNPAGALTIDPERNPGAKRMLELRNSIKQKNIRCVFHEPQYGKQLAIVLLEGTNARLVTLDPLGLGKNNVRSYTQLMSELGDAMHACLL